MGTTLPAPSARTMNEASSPWRNSSITSRSPAVPNCLAIMIRSRAATASCRFGADQDSLAGRQAVGLEHHGKLEEAAPKRSRSAAEGVVENPIGRRRDPVAGS